MLHARLMNQICFHADYIYVGRFAGVEPEDYLREYFYSLRDGEDKVKVKVISLIYHLPIQFFEPFQRRLTTSTFLAQGIAPNPDVSHHIE